MTPIKDQKNKIGEKTMSTDEPKSPRVRNRRVNIPGVTRSLAVQIPENDFRTFKAGAATLGMKHPEFVSFLLTLLPKSQAATPIG